MKNIKEEIQNNFKNLVKSSRKKGKVYLKTNILFMTFVITTVLNAVLLRTLTVGNTFDIYPIIGDLSVVIIIGAFGYFVKPKHQYKYFLIWTVIFSALCIINSMYYTNYLSFASLSLLETSSQIVDVGDALVENIMEIKDFAYLWQVLAIFLINRSLKKKDYYSKAAKIEIGKVRALNTMVVGLIIIGFFISTLNSTDISRLGKQWNREFIVMRFGIFTYQINDVIASIKPQISPLFGYDEASKEFREYYELNENVPTVNDYTNIFAGKNVLYIHAESIQSFTMDLEMNGNEVTPTLNRLASEGISFSNFYAQESVGTSSDSEFTINSSLMPASSGTVFISYWDRDFLTTQDLLKEKGYYTFSMHGNNGSMWNRNVVHPQLGYDRFFSSVDYDIEETIGLGISDELFFNQSVPYIKEINETEQNFMGTMIMLTNHTPWSNDLDKLPEFDVTMKYDHVDEETGVIETLTAPYLEGTTMGNYLRHVNYADKELGDFLEELDQEGILDNTVIVIYGDHDAKIKSEHYERLYNYDPINDSIIDEDDPNYVGMDFYDYELNRNVPFIIWSKDMVGDDLFGKEIDQVMGMIDVQPTLGNMFGFNNPYALGNDIFSTNDNTVIFPDGNWVTNKMYYNGQKEEGKPLTEEPVSIDYIEQRNKLADEILTISDSIIVYDLIKKTTETEKVMEEIS